MSGHPVRVAVVGLGWATRSIWLPRLRERAAFRLAAVVDSDPVALASVERGDDVALFADVGELDPAEIDLAVVAVPNHLHCALACRLLANGVSVFMEKPVCLTSHEVSVLAEAERASGAMVLAGSAAAHRADVDALLRLRNSLGRLQHVELGWVRARGVPAAGGWFTQRRLSGGGALVDLGSHLLDVGALLLGTTDIRHAVGTTSSHFIDNESWRAGWREDESELRPDSARLDVEDTARGFLVTADGVGVSVHASWASHEACDVTRVTLEGSAGTATLRGTFGFSPNRLERSTLTVARGGRTTRISVPDEPIGTEYGRHLDSLPGLLGDPANRGVAIARAAWTTGALERLYGSEVLPLGSDAAPAVSSAR